VEAEEVARAVRAQGVSPLAAAGVAVQGAGGGWAEETGGDEGVFFDLASVTKPMTAVAAAMAGLREQVLGSLVADARGTPSDDVSVELFLAHRAGLEGHIPLYEPLLRGETVDRRAALRTAARARRPDAQGRPPQEGFAPVYSDLGYALAGEALARAAGARDAGEAIDRLVLLPMGIAGEAGTVRELRSRGITGPFAPTETVAWRGGPVVGAVHDENAWALTGEGGSGHAGVFGTVRAVLAFGKAVLAASQRGELEWLVRERPGGTLRAGFDGKSADGSTAGPKGTVATRSSAGARMSLRAFGHLGFTGTSLWIDPDARVVVVLLTNRVCPTRKHLAIRAARPWAHDALFERGMALALGPSQP
jgi:CubicO group peptidase (beta-lactamase class C family)